MAGGGGGGGGKGRGIRGKGVESSAHNSGLEHIYRISLV